MPLCTFRFENPFRGSVPIVNTENEAEVTAEVTSGQLSSRRDSDSTLPDSEHTDRPQSSSLQSSGLQSDVEESVTETGKLPLISLLLIMG